MAYLQLELSYTTDENEFPEHWGYYGSFEELKEDLVILEKLLKESEVKDE